jgi:hypothetical protein
LKKDNETCSNAIYVDTIGLGSTSYEVSLCKLLNSAQLPLLTIVLQPTNGQNIYRTATAVPLGFGYVSQFSGVPQIVLPIGQVAYNLTISNHTEYLPLIVTMYAAQGCDCMLWDLAAALQVSVKTGVYNYQHCFI